MLAVPTETYPKKWHHPLSPASSRGQLSSAASSHEALLTPSADDVPLRSLLSASSSKKALSTHHASTSSISISSWPGHPRKSSKPQKRQMDDHTFALAFTLTLTLLVIIGVPLGAVLPQKYVVPLPVNVLIPFYINPQKDTWGRLFQTIISHPTTNFTVVVSIDHGPSISAWPSGVYLAPIKRLKALPNVRTIGYVDTGYGARDAEIVRKEIATYAGWNNTEIALSGIFLDHTPSEDVGDLRTYLKNVSATVRHTDGFDQPAMVVHNPGKMPAANMTSYHADVTVVFEGEYRDLPTRNETRTLLRELGGGRQDYAQIVHSVPRSVGRGGIRKIIDQARRDVEWLLITERTGDGKYEWYSDRWEEFLDLTF